MLSLLTAIIVLTQPVQDTAHVVVVATTDVHGHAMDWDYPARKPFPGGLSRVATVIDSLKARYRGQVVVVDAGDLIQGDPFATYFARVSHRDPNPVIEAMNLAGYDVATPGNHEFDWGLGSMRAAIAGAAFPYVSGNIYTLQGDTLLYPPYVVLQRNGVRIGVTGFTTPGVMVWDRDRIEGKVRVERIAPAAQRALESLRRESDLAVVLVHSGMDGPSSYDTTGVGAEHAAAALAANRSRPDLVVVGHSHREMRDSVIAGVHFVQPRPYAGGVSVTHIDLVRSENHWHPVRFRSEIVLTANVAPSARVVQRLASAHAAVLSYMDSAVGTALGSMRTTAARAEATPILNFINAVQRKRTGADLSAASVFDLKAGFDSGTIRMGQLVALYPFDNTLRSIKISGAQLKEFLEYSSRYYRTDAVGRISINDSVAGYNFDVVAGAHYDIDLRQPVGERIQNLSVGGRGVRPEDSFTMAVNSYRQAGGGGYAALRGAPVVYDRGENVRDLLVDEVRTRRIIDPGDYAARDWHIVPEGPARAVRDLFGVPGKVLASEPRDSIILRIMATGDLHGTLLPKSTPDPGDSATGGAAALAGLMDSLARDCSCATLRLDAGDAMQGTLMSNVTRGRGVVELFNRMGLGATALSEHDFEWSLDTLRQRMSEARYPWLAANVFDSSTGRRPEWIVPYRMLEGGGLRVALVGYVTAETKTRVKAALTSGLRFADGALAIHDVLIEVQALKPDLTIVLAHAGAMCEGEACTGEVVRLAEGLPPKSVGLLIAGHTHQLVSTKVAGVSIVEPGENGTRLAVADLIKTPAGGMEVRTRLEPVNAGRITPNPAIAALVEANRRRADSLTSRVVTNIKLPLVRSGDQYRLGSLIAEARRNVLRADVGLVGNASIRADLSAGPATYGQLFDVQPSQNSLVKVRVTGKQLKEVLEHALGSNGRPVAHAAGVVVKYNPKARMGRRVQSVELLPGRKLRDSGSYTLAIDDFLSTGGDSYNMLVGLPAEPSGSTDLEGLMTYLRRLPQPVAVALAPGFVSSR